MKTTFTVLLLITLQTAYGQECNTQAANKSIAYDPNSQSFSSTTGSPASWDISKMKPHLAKAESWIRDLLKDFKGAKVAHTNTYFLNPLGNDDFFKTTGLKGSYEGTARFFAYYCYDNKYPIHTEGESGSRVHVSFNNIFNHELFRSDGRSVNGKLAFTVLKKTRTEGRIDYYDLRKRMDFSDTVFTSKVDTYIIRNSEKPLFIPVTRKEYLQQLLKDVEDYKNKATAFAKANYTPASEAANKARFDEELKRIDNSKSYTPEQMAPYRKRFIETWETEKQKFDRQIARIEKETSEANEVLQASLKKPQQWLDRGVKDFYSYSAYSGESIKSYLDGLDVYQESEEDYTRSEMVTINPDYFDKSLTMDVPQLIMVTIDKNGYAYMYKLAELIKKPGGLTPLQNILTPGKQGLQQPLPIVTSNYKLSYLPKLNTLAPLTVPADMKPSVAPPITANGPFVDKLNFEIPVLSPKLKQLPVQPLTPDGYRTYVQELHTKISNAVKPDVRKKANVYIANKKLTQSSDIGNAAFAAWLQNAPEASLYIYGKAVGNNPTDALAANNYSAFLMMGGLPEKAIPILEFWNKQKPGEATLLANLGNAYYRLGDVTNATKYLQQCVETDSLHPTANKILCMMYLKKGDTKKAEEHGTKSLTTSHDEQVIAILRQLNNNIKVGEIMSRFPPLPLKQFPMLQRIKLPIMPSGLDDMEQFAIEVAAMNESLKMTIEAIEAKHPKVSDDTQQQMLMTSFKNGISPIKVKAQQIIMDGLQTYHAEAGKEADVFNYRFKQLSATHNTKMKAITKKYNDQLNKLEGGEGGEEGKIQALEFAKCEELNKQTQAYLPALAALVNQYAQRREYISRKFFRDYANWAPFWLPETSISFPSVEIDYLEDVLTILSEYKLVSKNNCSSFEPLPRKEGRLQEWEDEYCANFKGKIAAGPVKFFFTCNSWGMDGGEGLVGDFEFKYRNDGAFENFTVGAGIGANWHLGKEGVVKTEIGVSVKDFIKIGPDEATGKWIIKDAGVKGEVAGEAGIGKISVEEKVIEISLAVNAGYEAGGIVPAVLNLQ